MPQVPQAACVWHTAEQRIGHEKGTGVVLGQGTGFICLPKGLPHPSNSVYLHSTHRHCGCVKNIAEGRLEFTFTNECIKNVALFTQGYSVVFKNTYLFLL